MAVPYNVELKQRAERALSRIPNDDRDALIQALLALAAEPRPHGVLKLQGRAPLWRIRVPDYRVIYAIFDPDQLVTVAAVERRNERTYREVNDYLV